MNGVAFKRRLVCNKCCVTNYGLKQLCTTVKNFIANVLKCKACLKTKFKCTCITLGMSLFSRDYIKTEIN